MGPAGHCAMAFFAKPWAAKVPLAVLFVGTLLLDLLAMAFVFAGVEGGVAVGNPWSHSLLMSLVWSALAAVLIARIYRNRIAGLVVGLAVLSHWVLDLVSHPIPFSSFSFRTWRWDYGHPLPPDLALFPGSSTKVALGLYNSISAVQATALELTMLLLAGMVYTSYVRKARRTVKAGNV